MESVSSGGESPLSDSGDTVILPDNETPDKFEQRPSSGVSFLHFASIDGQTYEPRPPLTKQAIYETLAAQSSTVGCTTASERLPGLSFLQSHPSFSALLQSTSVSFVLRDGKTHLISGDTGHNLEPFLDVSSVVSSPSPSTSTNSTINTPLRTALQTHVAIAPKDISDDQKTPSPMEDSVSSNGRAPYPAVLRKKNREAARKCRQKKKNYLMQLENDFKELKQKYDACRQENDDLKRLILQRFNITLPPKKPLVAANEVRTLPSIAPHPAPHTSLAKAAPTSVVAATTATSPAPTPICPLAVSTTNAVVAAPVAVVNSPPVVAGQQVHLLVTPSPTVSSSPQTIVLQLAAVVSGDVSKTNSTK